MMGFGSDLSDKASSCWGHFSSYFGGSGSSDRAPLLQNNQDLTSSAVSISQKIGCALHAFDDAKVLLALALVFHSIMVRPDDDPVKVEYIRLAQGMLCFFELGDFLTNVRKALTEGDHFERRMSVAMSAKAALAMIAITVAFFGILASSAPWLPSSLFCMLMAILAVGDVARAEHDPAHKVSHRVNAALTGVATAALAIGTIADDDTKLLGWSSVGCYGALFAKTLYEKYNTYDAQEAGTAPAQSLNRS